MATPTPARYSLEGRTEKKKTGQIQSLVRWWYLIHSQPRTKNCTTTVPLIVPDPQSATHEQLTTVPLIVPDPQSATHEQLHNDSADSLVLQMAALRSKVRRESVYELGAVQTIFFQTSHIRPAGRLLREGTVSNGLRCRESARAGRS